MAMIAPSDFRTTFLRRLNASHWNKDPPSSDRLPESSDSSVVTDGVALWIISLNDECCLVSVSTRFQFPAPSRLQLLYSGVWGPGTATASFVKLSVPLCVLTSLAAESWP